MVRVLHVMARMPGAGTERQLAGMLRAAHGRHWRATLCVLYPGFPLVAELAADGVPVVELAPGPAFDPRRLVELRRLVLSGEVDVVHSSLWGTNAFTRLACVGPRRPAVVVSERRVEEFRPRWVRLVDRALRPMVDRYVANSPAVADFVARAHGVARHRIDEVPNGIDPSVFHPPATPRRPHGRGARIGCVGRLVDQKGFDTVIAALPAVLRHQEVHLAIAGEGEQRAALEAAAAGLPVDFVGFLPTPSEVAAFLRGLDLFVTASRYEGRANAVLEARACGLPVVATDVAGMLEEADGSLTLVRPDDPTALAVAVVAALAATGAGSVPPPPVPSFDEVARAHLQAFHSALEHRRAGRRRR
jgi:glycosyltransferase involved in cell wall biosynthesis